MFTGVIVNFFAVLAGSLAGLFLKSRFGEKYHTALINIIALAVVGIGVIYVVKTQNILVLILSLIVGTLAGTALRLDDRLESIGVKLQNRFKNANGTFAEGFAASSILFCVGSMAIMGTMDSGLHQNNDILITKSLIDGVTAVFLASTLGAGVMFSAVSVLVYEGALTLAFSLFAGSLDASVVNEISAVGGVILLGIAVNMLNLKKLKTADTVLSLFAPIALVPLIRLLGV